MSKDNTPSITTSNDVAINLSLDLLNTYGYTASTPNCDAFLKATQQIQSLILQCLPEKKPEYVKQRVGRDLFDVPAHSYNEAIDTIATQLREKGLIE